MKAIIKTFTVIIILLGIQPLHSQVIGQDTPESTTITGDVPPSALIPVPFTESLASLGFDPVTWEIVSLVENELIAAAVMWMNTPEQVQARIDAAEAILDPEIYKATHPRTPEQERRAAEELNSMLYPKTLAQKRASQSAEEIAAEELAVSELLRWEREQKTGFGSRKLNP